MILRDLSDHKGLQVITRDHKWLEVLEVISRDYNLL
jgi:hypothetical protein